MKRPLSFTERMISCYSLSLPPFLDPKSRLPEFPIGNLKLLEFLHIECHPCDGQGFDVPLITAAVKYIAPKVGCMKYLCIWFSFMSKYYNDDNMTLIPDIAHDAQLAVAIAAFEILLDVQITIDGYGGPIDGMFRDLVRSIGWKKYWEWTEQTAHTDHDPDKYHDMDHDWRWILRPRSKLASQAPLDLSTAA